MYEPTEMRFGFWTRVGQSKHVSDGDTLAQPGKYDSTVRVRRRCGLMLDYFDYLQYYVRRCGLLLPTE